MSTDKLRANVVNDILNDYAVDINSWFDDYAQYCGSPIEVAFLVACIGAWRLRGEYLHFLTNRRGFDIGLENYGNAGGEGYSAVVPQAVIGGYRVDFLFGHKDPELDKYPLTADGQLRPHYLIVECDGHDFHEKTKKQVSADKKRERELQALGFKIFRFSGSDIFNRSGLCASEVRDYFDGLYLLQKDFA